MYKKWNVIRRTAKQSDIWLSILKPTKKNIWRLLFESDYRVFYPICYIYNTLPCRLPHNNHTLKMSASFSLSYINLKSVSKMTHFILKIKYFWKFFYWMKKIDRFYVVIKDTFDVSKMTQNWHLYSNMEASESKWIN